MYKMELNKWSYGYFGVHFAPDGREAHDMFGTIDVKLWTKRSPRKESYGHFGADSNKVMVEMEFQNNHKFPYIFME